MAIKDKDGNVFRLRGPNPLMEEQILWDKKSLVLLNMNCETTTEKSTKPPRGKIYPNKLPVQPKAEVQEPVIEVVEVPPEPKLEVVKIPKYTNDTARLIAERKISFHCLPTIMTKDEFGTDIRVFSKKFIFEGIPVTDEDFSYSFWSDKKIDVGSIIFPITKNKRWWKVTAIEDRSGGYLMLATLSHLNPDFTD